MGADFVGGPPDPSAVLADEQDKYKAAIVDFSINSWTKLPKLFPEARHYIEPMQSQYGNFYMNGWQPGHTYESIFNTPIEETFLCRTAPLPIRDRSGVF